MADSKISALPASTTPLAGTEVLPIVQSSTTKQVSVANLTAGRAVSALSLTSTTTLDVTGTSTLSGNAIISVTDNTNAALRITQLGTGNALLVEDTTNPDATPFLINATGEILRGATTAVTVASELDGTQASAGITNASVNNSAALALLNYTNATTNARPAYMVLGRSNGAPTTQTTVEDADELGVLSFQGSDGTNFVRAASIKATVDGTPGTNDMPGRLVFSTTADGASSPTERMRINSSGNVGIGTSAPNTKLEVSSLTGSATPVPTEVRISTSSSASDWSTTLPWAQLGFYSADPSSAGPKLHASIAVISDIANGGTSSLDFNTSDNTGVLSQRMRIDSTGIVTMSEYGAGAATFSAAGVISSVSDETYKIKDGVIADPIPMIMALEAGYYYGKPEANMGEGRQLGFYAQNVRAAIGPEAAPDPGTYIVTDKDGVETIMTKPWGYYDRSVLAVAIEAIKVQQAQITALTARIAALENK